MPLQIVRQDITQMNVDAIVNSTNSERIGYSGVDLAVHRAAGKGLDLECASLPPLGVGQAQITGGYNLPSKYVIHTVGPIWQGGAAGESVLLRSAYIESLKLAVSHGCSSVALPLISSGNQGFPKDQVLRFAVNTVTEFLFDNELTVYICVFDKESYSFSRKLFDDIKEFIDDGYAEERADYFIGDEGTVKTRPRRKMSDAPAVRLEDIAIGEPLLGTSLYEYLGNMGKSFREMLFELIDKSGMTDVECYKRANVDKRTFSKIKSNKKYKPSKPTAVSFAISLRLNFEDTQILLATLGFTLSESKVFDKIIRYFIVNGNYDVFEINEALFEFEQPLLGSF